MNVTPFIIADTYNVNEESQYEEWKDANGKRHKDEICRKVLGSFEMKLPSEQMYTRLIEHIKQNDKGAMEIDMQVFVNNKNADVESSFFFTFKPIMKKKLKERCYKSFSFDIEEA